MDDPRVEQIMRTGYPSKEYLEHELEEESKLRDYKDKAVESGACYFEFPNGDIVQMDDLEDYAVEKLGASYCES